MTTIHVKGMSCDHCSQAVTKALSAIPGVSDVKVNLADGEVRFEEASPVDAETVRQAIERIGFEVA